MGKIQVRTKAGNKKLRELTMIIMNLEENTSVIHYKEEIVDSAGDLISEKRHLFKLKDEKNIAFIGKNTLKAQKTFLGSIIKHDDIQAFLTPPVEELEIPLAP